MNVKGMSALTAPETSLAFHLISLNIAYNSMVFWSNKDEIQR